MGLRINDYPDLLSADDVAQMIADATGRRPPSDKTLKRWTREKGFPPPGRGLTVKTWRRDAVVRWLEGRG